MRVLLLACAVVVAPACPLLGQSFVHWETPHVHPMDLTPDGTLLLVVNTPDNRLEVLDLTGTSPTVVASVSVGLDPVSVRAESNRKAWVVNQVSDSVSIVNLRTLNVERTLYVGDEPADVVFAGSPRRAFVSVSQFNELLVFDPGDLTAAPVAVPIEGEDPRALATDGTRVFAAVFESGNATTILGEAAVSSSVNPYAGDPNPPPNSGTGFNPPIAGGLPAPPAVGLVVRRDAGGAWRDDNAGDWSAAVSWDLHDHDVAIVDAGTLTVSYADGLMNLNMALAVSPAGDVAVVGTEALNEVRFEPNLAGRFLRVLLATFDPLNPSTRMTVDLNPHLDYTAPSVPQVQRDLSVGDPRGVAYRPDGGRVYVTGMGSNNLVVLDSAGNRLNQVEMPEGPTGVVYDAGRARLYVLSKFDATVTTVDSATELIVDQRSLYDPTPAVVHAGRPVLYDTHERSGLGHVSCASCHVDGKMDQLAWDLGDPQGQVKPFNQSCNGGLIGGCEDWHPMKGPMVTQTLVGILGTEPLHWRGDREDVQAFDVAFEGLLGDDVVPSAQEMQDLEDFLGTIRFPPNPNLDFFGNLPTSFPNGGDPVNGEVLFNTAPLDGGVLTCVSCHALPTGTNSEIISGNLLLETQSIKVPQLRNMYEKTGFSQAAQNNNRGYGFIKDGSIDTLFSFLTSPVFSFPGGGQGNQQRRDLEAFMLCLPTDTHAAVGTQSTLVDFSTAPQSQLDRIADMLALADLGLTGLVVKGRPANLPRGYAYVGSNSFQSDRTGEQVTFNDLLGLASDRHEMTFLVVPAGTETRIGIDRDEDGYLDRTEIDRGSDPADPDSIPDDGPFSRQRYGTRK